MFLWWRSRALVHDRRRIRALMVRTGVLGIRKSEIVGGVVSFHLPSLHLLS